MYEKRAGGGGEGSKCLIPSHTPFNIILEKRNILYSPQTTNNYKFRIVWQDGGGERQRKGCIKLVSYL